MRYNLLEWKHIIGKMNKTNIIITKVKRSILMIALFFLIFYYNTKNKQWT